MQRKKQALGSRKIKWKFFSGTGNRGAGEDKINPRNIN